MNHEFSRTLLFAAAADYFIISKMMGYCDNKNLNCCLSLANIYKPLLIAAEVNFKIWQDPLSGRQNLCSASSNDKDIDDFFDDVEDVFININIGIRQKFKIPMPQIYANGDNLNVMVCNEYLENIENFSDNLLNARLCIPISLDDDIVQHLSISLSGEVI